MCAVNAVSLKTMHQMRCVFLLCLFVQGVASMGAAGIANMPYMTYHGMAGGGEDISGQGQDEDEEEEEVPAPAYSMMPHGYAMAGSYPMGVMAPAAMMGMVPGAMPAMHPGMHPMYPYAGGYGGMQFPTVAPARSDDGEEEEEEGGACRCRHATGVHGKPSYRGRHDGLEWHGQRGNDGG